MHIRVKKLDPNAKLPTRRTSNSAGYDLYALEEVEVKPGETVFIHTGLAMEIPEGYFGAIYAGPGLACKHNLRPANCVGIIDEDYKGEICVAIVNDAESVIMSHRVLERHDNHFETVENLPAENAEGTYTIAAGERIAQIVIQSHEDIIFDVSDELSDSDRGEGGFGSTGSK